MTLNTGRSTVGETEGERQIIQLEWNMKYRKIQVLWNTTPCWLRSYWHFGGTFCLLGRCLKSSRTVFKKNVYCQLSEIFLMMLKNFIILLYKFVPLSPDLLFFLSFLSTVFRIPFTYPSSYLPSLSFTLKLHPKYAVTGRQKKSVMLRIKLLAPLSFCVLDFPCPKLRTSLFAIKVKVKVALE